MALLPNGSEWNLTQLERCHLKQRACKTHTFVYVHATSVSFVLESCSWTFSCPPQQTLYDLSGITTTMMHSILFTKQDLKTLEKQSGCKIYQDCYNYPRMSVIKQLLSWVAFIHPLDIHRKAIFISLVIFTCILV